MRRQDTVEPLDLPGTLAGQAVAALLAGRAPVALANEGATVPGADPTLMDPESSAEDARDAGANPVHQVDFVPTAAWKRIVGLVPSVSLRRAWLRHVRGWDVGRGVSVHRSLRVDGRRGGVVLGERSVIQRGCRIRGAGVGELVVGEDVTIGAHVTIVLVAEWGAGSEATGARVVVERGAIIGEGATLLGGAVVGENAIVAPGAVVGAELRPGSVFVRSGAPAAAASVSPRA